ncbi:MAG TPA: DoxX family protein [Acidimicrobiales bacterium]
MTEAWAVDLGLFLLRGILGVVMLAHGINHVFRGGKIKGTAGWFASMGMRPALVHAWLASLVEIGAGVALLGGLLTSLACAGVVGITAVAFIINHRKNGFFIFRPGEGYEYVLTLAVAATALALVGPGGWSLDDVVGVVGDLDGGVGLVIVLVGGLGGALATVATSWRPSPKA